MLAGLIQDARHALRRLLGAPGFTIAGVGILALGIGLSVTMFSTLYGVLLRGLPFPHAERLVLLQADNAAQRIQQAQLTAAEAARVTAGTAGFDALAYYVYWSETLDTDEGHTRDLTQQKVGAG